MNHNAAYLYLGGGYGARKVVRQSFDGVNGEKQYVQVAAPHSFTGFEIETGVIFRLQAVAISAGVQTNQFRYVEANLGIGVMF